MRVVEKKQTAEDAEPPSGPGVKQLRARNRRREQQDNRIARTGTCGRLGRSESEEFRASVTTRTGTEQRPRGRRGESGNGDKVERIRAWVVSLQQNLSRTIPLTPLAQSLEEG